MLGGEMPLLALGDLAAPDLDSAADNGNLVDDFPKVFLSNRNR
jgi:hypothetical protein